MEHALIPPVHRHSPYSWVVADATALDAIAPTAEDIGKLAWQRDDESTWLLTGTSPKTWVLNSVAPHVLLTMQEDIASNGQLASDAFNATETQAGQISALAEADQGIATTASNAAILASEARDVVEALEPRIDALEEVPAAGGAVVRPASTTITLDVPEQLLEPLYITGNTTITVAPGSPRLKGAKASMFIVPNGTGTVDIAGAEKMESSFDYKNVNRVPQLLEIEDKSLFTVYQFSGLMSGAALPAEPVVPGPVATFTAGASTTTTQALNGTPPTTGDPAVFTYTVAYRVNGSGAFPTPQLTGLTAFPINVTGLTAGTAYDYQITPSNSTGAGTPTTLLNVSTAAALQVPGAPTSIAAGTPTNNSIPITFGAPNTGGGSITDYEIQVAPAGTSFASPTTVSDGVSATTGGTATGLTASTAYDVRVRAINAAGPGAWATVSNITTTSGDVTAPTLLSAVVANATPTKITLTYSETLSSTLTDTVTVGGPARTVSSATVVGSTVEVVVDTAYVNGDAPTVSAPAGWVRDSIGNQAAALVAVAVTNNIGAGSNQADVSTMLAQVATDGGTLNQTEIDALNTLETTGRAEGWWSSITRLNCFVGDGIAAALVPLRNVGGPVRDTNVGMTYARATGFQTNGTSQYLNTGVNPPVATGGMSLYLRTAQPSVGTGYQPMGSRNASSQFFGFRANSSSGGAATAGSVVAAHGGWTPYGIITTGGMTAGLWQISRVSDTDGKLFKNGAQVATSTTSITAADPGFPVYVGGVNGAGTVAFYAAANSRFGAYHLGTGMTPTQAASFYTAMQAFQTALGRQV